MRETQEKIWGNLTLYRTFNSLSLFSGEIRGVFSVHFYRWSCTENNFARFHNREDCLSKGPLEQTWFFAGNFGVCPYLHRYLKLFYCIEMCCLKRSITSYFLFCLTAFWNIVWILCWNSILRCWDWLESCGLLDLYLKSKVRFALFSA